MPSCALNCRRGFLLSMPAENVSVLSVAVITWTGLAGVIRFWVLRGGPVPHVEANIRADCVAICPDSVITVAPQLSEASVDV